MNLHIFGLSIYHLLLPRSMKDLRYLMIHTFYHCIHNHLLYYWFIAAVTSLKLYDTFL